MPDPFQTPATPPSEELVALLAPKGTLRPAINLANTILTQQGPAGDIRGAALRIARALAARLQLPLRPVPYASAGQVTQALAADAWDLAFLAIDPARAAATRFTKPYLYIASTYLVRRDGPRTVTEVDAPGLRIAVAKGAAYELFLTRALRQAQLVHATTPEEAFGMFASGRADAVAGVRQALNGFAGPSDHRVLEDCFLQVQHAMAIPARAAAALPWLDAFLDELKHSGFVRAALSETGQGDASLAP